jgi:hypothetical protein
MKSTTPNKELKLTKPGTIGASRPNSRVVSSERRNISAMIREMCIGEARMERQWTTCPRPVLGTSRRYFGLRRSGFRRGSRRAGAPPNKEMG